MNESKGGDIGFVVLIAILIIMAIPLFTKISGLSSISEYANNHLSCERDKNGQIWCK